MKCCFCETEVESVEQAIELGWSPDFWQGEVNYQGPVCPDCFSKYLLTDKDGEYALKPGCVVPPLATPMTQAQSRPESYRHKRQKFPLGQIVATPAALQAITNAGQTPDFFLDKHIQGDWGEVCEEDKRLNDQAVKDGSRLLSAYRTLKNVRLWVLTEADRSATTIILPTQY